MVRIRSRATAFAVIVILLAAGVGSVVLSVVVFPPSSDIPEPDFSYVADDYVDLFQYEDVGEGYVPNPLGIFLQFPVVAEGMASLQLDCVNLSIWIHDVTTGQPNSSVILLVDYSVPTATENLLVTDLRESHDVDSGWWCCGTLYVDLEERIRSTGTELGIDLVFGVPNLYAPDHDGHQFLIRIRADVSYSALWVQEVVRTAYRSALFDFTLGESEPIYLELADGSPSA